jgi:hypothetical protein
MSKARVAVLGLVLVAGFGIQGQQPKPDHFKFWKVRPVETQLTVWLKGQFDEKEWRADLRTVNYLGNPVDKNKEGIPNEKLHLIAYSIRADKQVSRTVWLTNQFFPKEPAAWRLGQPAWLLVPADKVLKGEPGKPPVSTHYVCYSVEKPEPFSRPVALVDQFDRLMKDAEKIERLEPVYFCVPVQKKVTETISKILDPNTHLAVYKIFPPDKLPKPIIALTRDQFAGRKLEVWNSELLGVPSVKRKWEAAK